MREGFVVPLAVVFIAAAALLVPLGTVRPPAPPGAPVGDARAADEKGRTDNTRTLAETPVDTAESLLAQFFGVPIETTDTFEMLRIRVRQAATVHGYSLEALVAMAPDPIDSHSRWQFDPIQDALQRGAADSGFVVDRFYIPDWSPSKTPVAERGRVHESWPAVILFRNSSTRRLLVVFLAFETPTQGLHQEAFRKAVASIHGLYGSGGPALRILGPTFSGSRESLRIALRNLDRDRLLPATIEVVTGSATNTANASTIEETLPGRIRYQAAVLSDDDMLKGMVRHLIRAAGLRRGQLALLVEQNTGYGQAFTLDSALKGEAEVLQHALRIGFPLHVSRLRAAAEGPAARTPPVPGAARPLQSLSLREEGLITDQVPLFSDSTSQAYIELLLVNVLETLRRERITTVGLLATDTRDKLFLSQKIAHYCPNVRVFTLESDLLYAHPDYSAYMRGTLVASAYPLFNSNQSWTTPKSGEHVRSQFATSSSQGIYNAFRLLMNDAGAHTSDLLEYGVPFAASCPPGGCRPAVWISVNGRRGLWPVDAVAATDDYAAAVREKSVDTAGRRDGRMMRVRTWPAVFFWLFHFAIWIQVGAYLMGARPSGRWRSLLPASLVRVFARAAGPRRYLLGAFSSLFVLLLFTELLVLARLMFIDGELAVRSGVTLVFAVLTPIALAAVLADIAWRRLSVAKGQSTPATTPGPRGWMFAYRALFLVMLAAMLVNLVLAVTEPALALWAAGTADSDAGRRLLLFFERAVNLTNGVSPAVPVVLLCGALYVWGVQHFRTRGVPSRSILGRRLDDLDELRSMLLSQSSLAGQTIPGHTTQALDSLATIRLWVFAAALGFQYVWYRGGLDMPGVTTIESPAYTRFFQYGSMLLQGLVAVSLAQFLFVWARTREALEAFSRVNGVGGPLSRAFRRLPASFRRLGVFSPVPRLQDLEEGVHRAEALHEYFVHASAVPMDEATAMLARQPEFKTLSTMSAEGLRATFDEEKRRDPRQTFSDSQTWPQLVQFSNRAVGYGWQVTRSMGPAVVEPAAKTWLNHLDELVALNLSFIVREMAGRLVASMLLTLTLTLMILASHIWYPAQPKQVLMGFSWACILACVLASARVFVQMERNEVISHLTGTRPNHVTWDLGFISKIVLWVIVPLLSLFAAQFPEVGATLLQILQPVQKALP